MERRRPQHDDDAGQREPGAVGQAPDLVDEEDRQVADDDARHDAGHRGVEEREVALPQEADQQEPEHRGVHDEQLDAALENVDGVMDALVSRINALPGMRPSDDDMAMLLLRVA